MSKHLLFSFGIIFSVSSFAQNCFDSTKIYTLYFGGSRYHIVKELTTWNDAATCAVQNNGHLAHVTSVAEQNALYNALMGPATISAQYVTVTDGGGAAYVWIGATDKAKEGNWLWDGDADDKGVNFWSGEGNAGAGDGAVFANEFSNWGGSSNAVKGNIGNEPDNYGSVQDAAAIALADWPIVGSTKLGIAGEWNDLTPTNMLYYIIEQDNVSGINENNSDRFVFKQQFDPYNQTINLIFNDDHAEKNIQLFSVSGLMIQQTKCNGNNLSLNVTSLSAGIYFVQINGATQKVIIPFNGQ